MESKVIINSNEYSGEAWIQYENNQLIVSAKARWVAAAFGMIGYSLAKPKEKCRIDLNNVNSLKIIEEKKGKLRYIFSLGINRTCTLLFSSADEISEKLKRDFSDKLE